MLDQQRILDEKWMLHAIKLAKHAESCGEVPIGAVLVLNDRLLGEGWNKPITTCDPSAHAEVVALRSAGIKQNNYRLPNTTLYVTLEPCIMCLGVMIHARIERLVFGAKDIKAQSLSKLFSLYGNFTLGEDKLFNHTLKWELLSTMENNCRALLKQFFMSKRHKAPIT